MPKIPPYDKNGTDFYSSAYENRVSYGVQVTPYRIEQHTDGSDTIYSGANRRIKLQEATPQGLGGDSYIPIYDTYNTADQSSFLSKTVHWEDLDSNSSMSANWDKFNGDWSNYRKVGLSGTALETTGLTNDCWFVYIKNLGKADATSYLNDLYVSLNGETGVYSIVVPPYGAVCIPWNDYTGSVSLEIEDIWIKSAHSSGSIVEHIALYDSKD